MKKHILALTASLLLGTSAFAADPSIGCELEKAKAELQAKIDESPKAIVSVGSTVIDTKNVVVGVSQSLSGWTKASYARQAAAAKCEAIAATATFEEYALFSDASVSAAGAKAQLASLDKAIALAKTNLDLLTKQLAAQTVTINEHTAARLALIKLEQKQSDLLKVLAQPRGLVTGEKLTALAATARSAESRAVGFASKAQAESGWDVVVSAGTRQPTSSSGSPQAFIAISAQWSFGYNGAKDTAKKIESLTQQYLQSNLMSIDQQIERQKGKLEQLLLAEKTAIESTSGQLDSLKQVKSSLEGLTTTLAQNSARNLSIEILALEADLAGASARAAKIKDLLSAM